MNLKVLIYVDVFSELSETFIYNLIKGLERNNVTLIVVCLSRINEEKKPFDNVKILKISKFYKRVINKISKNIYTKFHIRTSIELNRLLKSFNPDLIHCHFGDQAFNIIDNIYKNIPIIISFHGYDASTLPLQNKQFANRLKNLFKKKNIYPVYCCKALLNNLKFRFNIVSSNSRIIPYGIDINIKATLEHEKSFKCVQISRLAEKKGTIYSIKAIENVRNLLPNNFKFLIAGDGPERAFLEKYVFSKNLSHHIKFVGWVNEFHRNKLLNSCDFYIQHSLTSKNGNMEGLPNSILEAMSYGLPILSTFHSGIPEMVTHRINGLLSDEKDIIAFSKNLIEIISWDKKIENKQKIIDYYSSARYIKDYKELYLSLT